MFKFTFINYPKINNIGIYNKGEYNFFNSIDDLYYLFIVKTGSITFYLGDQILTINKGEYAFFSTSDKINFPLTQATDDVVFYHLAMYSEDIEVSDDINFHLTSYPSFISNTFDKIHNFKKIEDLFDNLIYEYNNNNLMGCIGYLSLIFSTLSLDNSFYKPPTKDFLVLKIIRYIQLNFQRKITLDEFCKLTNSSSTYINNFFRKNEGCTVMNYVNKYRIEVAKKEIDKGVYSIDQISKYVGFNYKSHFYKVFKKHTGLTPTEYYKNSHTHFFSNFDHNVISIHKEDISSDQSEQ